MTGPWWLPILPAVAVAALYGLAAHRLTRRGDRWSPIRSGWFLTGTALGLIAVLPPFADPPSFPMHVLQHLLLAMAAPFALALSAPVTLALRTLPIRPRRVLLRLLHSPPAAVLMTGPVVLALEVGGLAAYSLTGLFGLMEQQPWLHLLVHGHMVLTGCLFSWYLVGVDPLRGRPSTRARVAVLLLAAGAHDVVAKLMYVWAAPAGEPVPEVREGAQLLFSGGDVIDLLLMVAVLLAWYRRGGRALARDRRRAEARISSSAGA